MIAISCTAIICVTVVILTIIYYLNKPDLCHKNDYKEHDFEVMSSLVSPYGDRKILYRCTKCNKHKQDSL